MGATDLIQEVIHARKRVEVMDSHFVERPEVDPKAERAIIPLEEAGFRNPIAGGRNDNTFGEHVGDGLINAIVVKGGMSASSHVDRSGFPSTNGMLYREGDNKSMRGLEC